MRNALLIGAVCLGIGLAGCSSNPTTEVVDQSDDQGPQTAAIDYRDVSLAVEQNTDSLMAAPILTHNCPGEGQFCVVAISNMTNNTTQRFEMDAFIRQMRIQMLNSGRFIITTAVSLTGPEDQMLTRQQELRDSREVNQATVASEGQQIAPDYSLTGRVYEENVTLDDGRRQVQYVFSLTLTDMTTGLAFWEDESRVVKRTANDTVGW